jgi:hypothetical protein
MPAHGQRPEKESGFELVYASHYHPSGAARAKLPRAPSRRGLRLPAVAAFRPLPFA